MVDPKLLAMLRCPIDGSPLEIADSELIETMNVQIKEGRVRDRADQMVFEPIDGGLIHPSGDYLFPIRSGIPTLIADEAILCR